MKTLDEVIDYCEGKQTCGEWVGIADALHYLKTYRENQHAYIENSRKAEEARERYMEEFKNCELAENKYKRLCEETSQKLRNTSQITCPKCHSEFVILPDANNPLSWDELRTMDGKPVWVESSDSFNRRRWMFVGEWFDDDEMRLFDMGNDYPDYVSKNGYESGTWQAYRKERE